MTASEASILPEVPEAELLAERRVRKLAAYLETVRNDGLVTLAVADLAWAAWRQVRASASGALDVPDACPGPDGQMLYSWERQPHYLEIEIFPDGRGEFFYRNDETGRLWEAEYVIGTPLPSEAAARLALFTTHEQATAPR